MCPAALYDLFPPITPYAHGHLDVGDGHSLYWEQSGNPDGAPILLLHGGPGAGASPQHRRFFDPQHYRIIIFDQRGAGRSTPLASIENNTPQHLVDDIERLRIKLNIDHWHVFGGSWGSTLALLYASQHSTHVRSLILRGIFLCEKEEIDWFLYGMGYIFPEIWDQFTKIIPEDQRHDLLTAYYKRLTDERDEKTQINCAVAWSLYESACSSLIPNYDSITTHQQQQDALAISKIEAHYFTHHLFSEKNSLLNHIETLRKIPTTIIQGRYDVICPIKTAHKLHEKWPEAHYVIVPDGGHSALDAPIRSALIKATEDLKLKTT